jgi:TonB family protein
MNNMNQLSLIAIVLIISNAMLQAHAQTSRSAGAQNVAPKFAVEECPNISLSTSIGQSSNFYIRDLQKRIKRAWFPPTGHESSRVSIAFTLHKDGKATDIRVSKPSGLNIADSAALKAVENAAPFRPLPEGAPETVIVEYTFDYEVFSGRRNFQ